MAGPNMGGKDRRGLCWVRRPRKYGFEVTEPASTPADVLSTDPAIGAPMLDRETIAARIQR